MTLAQISHHKENNFDLLRILLSIIVVYGHTTVLNGGGELYDPIGIALGGYCGSFAVKMFFILSGFLVTNSILRSQSPSKFVFSRFFRIAPGLITALTLIGVFIGPFFSTYSVPDYFNHLLNPKPVYYSLPGVMDKNPGNNSMFGTIWTIRWEVYCYALLLAIYVLLFSFKPYRKAIAFGLILLTIAETFFPFNTRPIFGWMGSNPDLNLLPAIFSIGVLLALFKNVLQINIYTAAAAFLLAFSFKNSFSADLIISGSIFYILLYIFSLKRIKKWFPIKYDISYGIYVYGFFVGQCVYHFFGTINPLLCFLITLFFTIIIALISFICIEKPAMKLGNDLNVRLMSNDILV